VSRRRKNALSALGKDDLPVKIRLSFIRGPKNRRRYRRGGKEEQKVKRYCRGEEDEKKRRRGRLGKKKGRREFKLVFRFAKTRTTPERGPPEGKTARRAKGTEEGWDHAARSRAQVFVFHMQENGINARNTGGISRWNHRPTSIDFFSTKESSSGEGGKTGPGDHGREGFSNVRGSTRNHLLTNQMATPRTGARQRCAREQLRKKTGQEEAGR